MGISRTTAQLLLAEAARQPFTGCVATLGRQHTYFQWDEFCTLAERCRVSLSAPSAIELHREPGLARQGFVSDQTFLTALGFSEVNRIDVSDYEDVDVLLDLNAPETPESLCSRFDVILDSGTIEHVFHVPNALAHLHRMLKASGRIIHLSPSANYLDHGFYCFSPTFFADYYRANRYDIHGISLCRYLTRGVSSAVDVYDCQRPVRSSGIDVGDLDNRVYNTFAVVQRRDDSTCGRAPQQSGYVKTWDSLSASTDPAGGAEAPDTKAGRLLELTAFSPALQQTSRRLITAWRSAWHRYRRWRSPLPWPKILHYS